MKLTNYKGSKLIAKEIEPIDILKIVKVDIPVTLSFLDFDGKLIASEDIKLTTRLGGKEPHIMVESKERKQPSFVTFDTLAILINNRQEEGLLIAAVYEKSDVAENSALMTILPYIQQEVIMSATHIQLDKSLDKFIVNYQDFKNGASNKLLYYNENNSILMFTEAGPNLVTDEPGIQSIRDLICD